MSHKTIKGFVDHADFKPIGNGQFRISLYRDNAPDDKAASLTIFDGPAERMFTESEVKAMLNNMAGQVAEYEDPEWIAVIAAKHGIDL